MEHSQRLRVQQFAEVALVGAGILDGEEAVVETNLGLDGVLTVDPMQRLTLDFAVSTGHSATRLGVVGGIDGSDVSLSILVAGVLFVALDDVGVLQTHLLARSQTLELLFSHLHEVAALYPELAAEGDGMRAVGLVFRVVDGLHLFRLTLGIVGEHQFDGVEHGTDAGGLFVQVVANAGLQ